MNKQKIFNWACRSNQFEVAKLLLKDSQVDPSAWGNEAIKNSCINGDIEIVKLLLSDSRVDPSDGNNAIRNAGYYGHTEIVRLLLEDHRVDPSVIDINKPSKGD